MNKRVLLIGNMNGKWVFQYIQEMVSKNIDVTVLNKMPTKERMADKWYQFCEDNNVDIISIFDEDNMYSRCLQFAAIINALPDFDVCHVMYVGEDASILVRLCERKFRQIVVNYMGGDFYDNTFKVKYAQSYLLNIADLVIVPLEYMKKEVEEKYPFLCGKIQTIRFRDTILEKMRNSNVNYSLKKEKIVIAGGYCGNPEQQQEMLIRALAVCSDEVQKRVFVVFPMTYGSTEKHEKYIHTLLTNVKFEYKIIKDYMTENQMVELWSNVDIFVNAVLTDALNGALLENMFSQSVILTGAWKEYPDLEKEKSYLCKFSDEKELASLLEDVVCNINQYKENSKVNKDIINRVCLDCTNIVNWNIFYADEYITQNHLENNTTEILKYIRKQMHIQSDRLILYNKVFQKWLERKMMGQAPIKSFILQQQYNNIIIYGAGVMGKMVCEEIRELDIEVTICDKDVRCVEWFDKEVISPKQLQKIASDCILVTPVHAYDTIVKDVKGNAGSRYVSILDVIVSSKESCCTVV